MSLGDGHRGRQRAATLNPLLAVCEQRHNEVRIGRHSVQRAVLAYLQVHKAALGVVSAPHASVVQARFGAKALSLACRSHKFFNNKQLRLREKVGTYML